MSRGPGRSEFRIALRCNSGVSYVLPAADNPQSEISNPQSVRRGGGIGRHTGLKIPRPARAVPVRVRPSALYLNHREHSERFLTANAPIRQTIRN